MNVVDESPGMTLDPQNHLIFMGIASSNADLMKKWKRYARIIYTSQHFEIADGLNTITKYDI
jgi:hypothetical protein